MTDNPTTRPIDAAVDAALFQCPLIADRPAVSREECELMVRCAISTWLNKTSHDLGQSCGLTFWECE